MTEVEMRRFIESLLWSESGRAMQKEVGIIAYVSISGTLVCIEENTDKPVSYFNVTKEN